MPRMLIRAVAAVQPRFGTQETQYWDTRDDQVPLMTSEATRPGKLTKSYWKWPFIVSFPSKNGDFPVRYVKLPEAMFISSLGEKIAKEFTCELWSRWIGWPTHEEVLVNYGHYGYKVDWCSKGGHPKIVEICPGFDLDHLVSALEMSGNYSHLPRMDWYSVSGLPHVCPFGKSLTWDMYLDCGYCGQWLVAYPFGISHLICTWMWMLYLYSIAKEYPTTHNPRTQGLGRCTWWGSSSGAILRMSWLSVGTPRGPSQL